MIKNIFRAMAFLGLLIINACTDEPDPRVEEESFTKIYDTRQFDASVIPIDIKQTSDGGYLILADRELADSDFAGIYLMKVDNKGNFVKEIEVESTYLHPVGNLIEDQGSFYFFCMDVNTIVNLAKVDENAEGIE